MDESDSRPDWLFSVMFFLMLIGFGGLYAGIFYLIDPSGALLGISNCPLYRSPLQSYNIPAFVMLILMGALPLFLVFALWQRPAWFHNGVLERASHEYWAWGATVFLGLVVMAWVAFQAALGFGALIHWVMLFGGIGLLASLLMPPVRRYYAPG